MEGLAYIAASAARAVERALVAVAVLLMTALVLIVFAGVVSRYFLNSSIAWAEEISRFILIWAVFIGAVLAYGYKEHLGLDLLVKLLPRSAARACCLAADALILYALYLVFAGGVRLASSSMDSLTPALEIPSGYQYMIVPVSAVLMAAITIRDIVSLARGTSSGRN